MWIPLVVLALVFLLIALRSKLKIWQIMLAGALAVVLTGRISPADAFAAIHWEIILFLFCVFLLGRALEQSGYLAHLSYRYFRHAKNTDSLLLFILFGVGMMSALLMNDTLAIIGTPVMLLLAKEHKIKPTLLLLALMFAVTIGSIMSPIGNPQNLLVAVQSDMQTPFVTFLRYLFIPTLICLFIAYLVLKFFYRDSLAKKLEHKQPKAPDPALSRLCKISLSVMLMMIFIKIISSLLSLGSFDLVWIGVVGVMPILFAKERHELVKTLDWGTLIFFVAMFVLMESVWQTGFFQSMISSQPSVILIIITSIIISQFISNVPLVALYLPVLLHSGAGDQQLVALAAGSTLAGNLFILGAASNVIVIQAAERLGYKLTFWEFARVGIPLTLLNTIIYCLLLSS